MQYPFDPEDFDPREDLSIDELWQLVDNLNRSNATLTAKIGSKRYEILKELVAKCAGLPAAEHLPLLEKELKIECEPF